MKKMFGAGIAIACVALMSSVTFASGEVNTENTSSTTPVVVASAPTAEQAAAQKAKIACMKQATLTREGNLMAAVSAFTNAAMISYNIRSSAISDAYDSGKTMKEIRAQIKKVFETWKTSIKTARETLKKSRKDAWAVFKKDVSTCKTDRKEARDILNDMKDAEKADNGGL